MFFRSGRLLRSCRTRRKHSAKLNRSERSSASEPRSKKSSDSKNDYSVRNWTDKKSENDLRRWKIQRRLPHVN